MTFKHKLARRLARLRSGPMLLLPFVAACAAGEPTGTSSDSPLDTSSDGAVALSPRAVTLEGTQGVLFRAFASLIPGSSQVTSIEWTASGGSIDAGGSYTPASSGAFRIVGRRKGNPHNPPDTSVVVVVPPQPTIIAIDVTPSTATVAGGLQQPFDATGRLSDGTQVAVGVNWTATGGTIDAGGLYTAPRTAGSYKVIAKHVTTGLADTATVTVPPATLTSITLSPSSVSLSAGQGQQFGVTGRLSDGTTSLVPVAYSATGGSISVGGFYTAGSTGGTFRLIATAQGGLADTSAITISGSASPPPPGGLWRNEDFSTYGGNTATWQSNPYGWMRQDPRTVGWFHAAQQHIDTQQLYNGHPTLRYDWPAYTGCEGTPQGDYAIVASYKAPGAREVWIEASHKFASNFDAHGWDSYDHTLRCTTWAYKFLLMWRPIGDRFDIINGSYGHWNSAVPRTPDLPATQYPNGNYCTGDKCTWGYGPGQSQYLTNVPGQQWDGQWHVYRVHVRVSSSATTPDGIFEVWVDGKQTVGWYGIANAKADGSWFGSLTEIFLGGNANSGVAADTQTWWGHLKIWTSNPAW